MDSLLNSMRWPVAKVTITIEDEFENDEEGRLNVRMAFGRGEMTADTPMTPAQSCALEVMEVITNGKLGEKRSDWKLVKEEDKN
jgi:hypothetical protein